MRNTRRSTAAESVATDAAAGHMLWTSRLFLLEQGYDVKTILYQDNRSAILLESKGCSSAGKHSRHRDIRYLKKEITTSNSEGQDEGSITIIIIGTVNNLYLTIGRQLDSTSAKRY